MWRYFLIGLLSLLSSSVVWAGWEATPEKPFVLGELVDEMYATTQAEMLCADTNGTISCRKIVGEDFTDSEREAMETAVRAHDPDVRAKRAAKRSADRASGDAKLKALGLTEAEIRARP